MLELVSYGLTGLAATVVMAFCSAYSGEFYLPGKPLIDQTDKALGVFSRQSGEGSADCIRLDGNALIGHERTEFRLPSHEHKIISQQFRPLQA